MIGTILTVIYCVFALIVMSLFVRGIIIMMKDPKATEDDRWIGGVVMFGVLILIGLHVMMLYVMFVG